MSGASSFRGSAAAGPLAARAAAAPRDGLITFFDELRALTFIE
jgi:hypothetical protein